MHSAKILVVDDEKEICEITREFLQKKHYHCFCAYSAQEALELVKKEHPQAVLLDIRLGDASGLDVLPKIKKFDQRIKVIMVTGLGDDQTINEAKSKGADDFLIKPFTATFLSELLAKKLSS
ncbi:MAG: response regulator [Candidatus Omnitrophica bacterium]|nr:response regulator [Candidatus Omnitrophota bacterium]MDD5653327.1 response regulator [Candidatus Omnitrophota bacterium]